jgi:hypothetical protein
MFAKLQIPQNLWKLYACMGSLGCDSIFTTKIILKVLFKMILIFYFKIILIFYLVIFFYYFFKIFLLF